MSWRFKLLFLFISLCIAGLVSAQTKTLDNSGFVPGNLWLSKEPTVPGETVKIYTLVWNGSGDDISGTVSFFDNDTPISKQDFILAGGGSSKALSAPWTVTPGYHKIYAEITNSSGGPRGSKAVTIVLQYAKTEEAEQFVGGPKENTATTTAKSYVEEKIDFAKGYAEANLPKPVVGTAKYLAQNIESARGEVKGWSDKKTWNLKKELASTTPGAENKWLGVDKPFKYATMFFASLISLISGNVWLFYGLIAATVFFVLKFIKNKFFF